MSEFLGLEGLDLSGVEVKERPSILGLGEHIVSITDAKVVRNDEKKTAQLELTYENSDGSIRNWLWVYHASKPGAQQTGLKQVKELLLTLGHDGNTMPGVEYFKGKAVGINIVNDEYMGKVRKKVNYHYAAPQTEDKKKLDDEIPF